MTARLTRRPGGAARRRALLESGETIVAPGAFGPLAALLAATAASRGILREITRAWTPAAALPGLPTFDELVDFLGLPEVCDVEQRHAAEGEVQ